MLMHKIGTLVTKHAKAAIAFIIVITIIFGYFAAQMQMDTDYKSFMPDDEISRAYAEVNDDYYSTEMVQVLIRYNNGNAVSKQALIEELKFEKQVSADPLILKNLQTPSTPSKSIYSVAELVISADMASKSALKMMNDTIEAVPALEIMNASLYAINSNLSLYLNNNSNDTVKMNALNTSAALLNNSLAMGDDIELPQAHFSFPSMTIDRKIAYINNMSNDEIKNILAYGIPSSPYEMQDMGMKFMKALRDIKELSGGISTMSGNISSEIDQSLSTEPVYSDTSINYTFSSSYIAFSQMQIQFSDLSSETDSIFDSMNSDMFNSLTEILHSMISSDFDGRAGSAEGALLVVNLNGTSGAAGSAESGGLSAVHERIRDISSSFKGEGKYSVMSMRLMNEDMSSGMNETFGILLPAAFVLVIIILLLVFRNILDTVLGLLGLFMAIIWTYGIGVMAGFHFNMITTTVAILIVGLGIDYAIHTIMRYREELKDGNDVPHSIMKMESNLGMALILATVTTMISFLSNLSSPIPPLRDYGIMNAVGIFSAFILFITFIPSVKALIDTRKENKGKNVIKNQKNKKASVGVKPLNTALLMGAVAAERHPWKVIIIVIILSLGAFYGAMNLSTDFSESDFLPQNTESYQILTYISDNFNASGMEESYVLVKGDISSPEVLTSMEQAIENMKDDRYISQEGSQNIVSLILSRYGADPNFTAMVDELDTNGDHLPDSNITQVYDYLYSHEERTKYVLYRENGAYESTLMRFKPTSRYNSEHAVLYNELRADIAPLKDNGYYAQITGGSIMTYVITSSLQDSQWNSLILTLVLSLAVLSFVFWYERRAPMLGVITTLPVLIALLWSMGIMYLMGMNFDMMTVTITALTIGLGITYSIHLTHRFTEELNEKSPEEAIRSTVLNTGSAVFGAAATTMGGFGILMLSSMPPMQDFGIIATLSILLSFLLSVFVLPTFLVMWARNKK